MSNTNAGRNMPDGSSLSLEWRVVEETLYADVDGRGYFSGRLRDALNNFLDSKNFAFALTEEDVIKVLGDVAESIPESEGWPHRDLYWSLTLSADYEQESEVLR
jgi:hypothetical protein|tara:strand:- start:1463 stop:1774 length:312 start_codon:yes stop_codon:yes gene_type:complete